MANLQITARLHWKLFLVSAFTISLTLNAQTQPAPPQSNRGELLKVQPNISGQRNGVFIEPDPMDFENHTGYISLFDGKTLAGWDGQPGTWSVEDGAIVGKSTKDHVAGNTFLVYRGIKARDFDLKLEIKVEWGGGSGIQYRSSTGIPPGRVPGKGEPPLDPRWVMIGPQADFWFPVNEHARQYSGQLYSQNTTRGIIVWRGQVVQSLPGKLPRLVGNIGDRAQLGTYVKDGEWNEYTIIARGGVIMHILNGQLMAVLVDDDPASSNNVSGLFGLQIEGTPCKVSFRNLWLKKID
ncbi:MAG TPA: DUF1080 domain-containing protein [Terracidiphilus sp.]|nr:DUF1080 domain-containing protein [Terracidiphilus sp.]